MGFFSPAVIFEFSRISVGREQEVGFGKCQSSIVGVWTGASAFGVWWRFSDIFLFPPEAHLSVPWRFPSWEYLLSTPLVSARSSSWWLQYNPHAFLYDANKHIYESHPGQSLCILKQPPGWLPTTQSLWVLDKFASFAGIGGSSAASQCRMLLFPLALRQESQLTSFRFPRH